MENLRAVWKSAKIQNKIKQVKFDYPYYYVDRVRSENSAIATSQRETFWSIFSPEIEAEIKLSVKNWTIILKALTVCDIRITLYQKAGIGGF